MVKNVLSMAVKAKRATLALLAVFSGSLFLAPILKNFGLVDLGTQIIGLSGLVAAGVVLLELGLGAGFRGRFGALEWTGAGIALSSATFSLLQFFSIELGVFEAVAGFAGLATLGLAVGAIFTKQKGE